MRPSVTTAEDIESALEAIALQVDEGSTKQRAASVDTEPVTVGAHHFVRWECVEAYGLWLERIHTTMRTFPGFLSLRITPPSQNGTSTEREMHGVLFRFRSAKDLHDWLYSQERASLLAELGPLLHAPTQVSANSSRSLPDGFTDLLVSSNDAAPLRPPPKWKVVLLTTCSLFLIVYPTGQLAPPVFRSWGVTSPYGQIPLSSVINVGGNAYMVLPLLQTLIGRNWLALPRPAVFEKVQPFKALEQGFRWRVTKMLIVVAYFGSTIIAGALKAS